MEIECLEVDQVAFSYEELAYPELVEYAKNNLPLMGMLMYNENENYCYLKVHDDFILKLFPFLNEGDDVVVPLYFPPENVCGAHISIVYPEEKSSEDIKRDIINGVISGPYSFLIGDIVKVTVLGKVFYTVTVISPELEALRINYDLPSKLDYKRFMVPLHITIAIKQDNHKDKRSYSLSAYED